MGRHTAPSLGPCRRAKRSTNGTGRSYISVHLTVSEFDQVRHGATARGTSLSRWVIDRSLYQTTMYEREALSTGTSQAQSLLNDVASAGALVNDGARQANTDGTLISEWADLVQRTSRLVARCDEFTERFHPHTISAQYPVDEPMIRAPHEPRKLSPVTGEKRQRLNVRVTEEEKMRIVAGATMAGTSQSSWILHKALSHHQGADRGTVQDFISLLQQLVRQLVGIGTNLQQVATIRADSQQADEWVKLSKRCRGGCREMNAIAHHWTRYV